MSKYQRDAQLFVGLAITIEQEWHLAIRPLLQGLMYILIHICLMKPHVKINQFSLKEVDNHRSISFGGVRW